MAQAVNIPLAEGSVSVIIDDNPDAPIALQLNQDLAAMSLRMTAQQAKEVGTWLIHFWGETLDI